MMMDNERKRFVKGALLLTLAGLISKILSAGYRIPLQNLTGDLGFYMYQQVYPFLGIVLILSLYGFPSAVSKLTVELKAAGKSASLRSFYFPIFILMLGITSCIFFVLYFNASFIAKQIGDENLTNAYQLIAWTFLLIPFTSLLRGFFQGNYQMKPTAYSQVGEQLIRVGIIILVAYLVFIQKIEVYKIGEAAAWASLIGALVAIVILVSFWMKEKPLSTNLFPIPWKYYFQTIFLLGIVASLNHMVLLIIQFADVFTLVPNLKKYGLSTVGAMKEKGIFDRGQPLIQLGTVLGSSFALALIPALSKQKLKESPEEVLRYIQGGLLFSFYLAAGAVIGLIFVFPSVNLLLFQDTKGTTSLQILSIAIFLSSVSITGSSILQGLGYFKRTAGYIVGAFIIKWITNLLLVPLWGITGSSLATICSLLFLCVVIILELRRSLPSISFFKQIYVRAFTIASLSMIGYIMIINYLFPYDMIASRFGLSLYVMFIAITGAMIYLLLLLKCRAFTTKELMMLPRASFFIKIHRGRDRFAK